MTWPVLQIQLSQKLKIYVIRHVLEDTCSYYYKANFMNDIKNPDQLPV